MFYHFIGMECFLEGISAGNELLEGDDCGFPDHLFLF